ncbi:MAG: hypothetical protein HY077_02065 [Elusimicrobia bacterium]|nr:hypothetical protein [Elusimicrobiota bacterium]
MIQVLTVVMFVMPVSAQDSIEILNRHFGPPQIWRTAQDGLEMVCYQERLLCGFAQAGDESAATENSPRLIMSSGTVKDVLTQIVSRYPAYQWQVRKGIINMEPRPGHWPGGKNRDPLDSRVQSLNSNSSEPYLIAIGLCEKAGLIEKRDYRTYGGAHEKRELTMEFHRETLRNALNRLVKRDGSSMWFVNYDMSSKEFFCNASTWPMRE